MISGDTPSSAADRHDLEAIGNRVFHDESCNDLSTRLCYFNTGLNLERGRDMRDQ